MKRKMKAGTTSVSLAIFVQDAGSSSGAGLGGLAWNTSGLVAEYRRHGESSWTTITLVNGKTLGTWLSGGIVADGALAGCYEIDLPNAAVAGGGARWVIVRLRGATNMLPVLCEIELDQVDYQDGTRFGLFALPNAFAGSNGGLPLSVDTFGRVDARNITGAAQTFNLTGNITGSLSGSVGSVTSRVTANTDQLAGQAVSAAAGVTFPTSVASPTNITSASGVTLTSGERAAIAAVIEAEVLNDATGGAVITTIANAVAAYFDNASLDVPPQVIATAVRNALAVELSRIDVAVSSRMATYTQPAGFLATTFPTTVASPTNITAASGIVLAPTTHTGAVIPTVTNVTNVSVPTAAQIASQVRTELASELTVVGRLGTTLEANGLAWRFTVGALAQAPNASDTLAVTVMPSTVEQKPRSKSSTLNVYVGETITTAHNVIDGNGNPVTLTGKTLKLIIRVKHGEQLCSLTPTVSGSSFSATLPTNVATQPGRPLVWALRDKSPGAGNVVLGEGAVSIDYAADED